LDDVRNGDLLVSIEKGFRIMSFYHDYTSGYIYEKLLMNDRPESKYEH